MAISVQVDLVDGGDFSADVDDTGRVRQTATRMAFVRGVNDGSDRGSATALIRAQAAVQALYPIFTLYDPLVPLCVLRGYRNEGVPENSDAVRVRLIYGTFTGGQGGEGGGGQYTPWTLTDDWEMELVETQIDPKGKAPMYFSWNAKSKKGANGNDLPLLKIGPELATFRVSRTVRRVVISGIITRPKVDELTTLANTVNEGAFDLEPTGWWRCNGVHSETSLGAKFWKVSVTFDKRVDQDWSEFQFLRYRGKLYADAASVKQLKERPYRFGVEGPGAGQGGVLKFGPYEATNFNRVLGISRWADLYRYPNE